MLRCTAMTRIALVGSLTFDRIMTCGGEFKDYFLPEMLSSLSVSFLIDTVTTQFGGTAGNIAYNLSLLSLPSEIIATAGHDAGHYIERLKERGIRTDTIAIAEGAQTATAYVITDAKDNQISPFAPGAGAQAYERTYPIADAALVMVSPTSADDMERFPREAKEANIPYFFDPGQQTTALSPETLRLGIEGSHALFVNEYELALVIEKTGWSEQEIREHVDLLVVTLGSDGSRLCTKDGETQVRAVSAKAVDPTGAGDAYRAGFIAGYLAGLSHTLSAQIGSTLAAFAVESTGCQNHEPAVETLIERYEASYGEPWPL